MELAQTLRIILSLFDQHSIPYVLVGSLVSSAYGEPRSTRDIDVIINPSIDQLRALVGSLPPDRFYVSEEAAMGAFADRGMFNVIDQETGWKVDCILLADNPYNRAKFDRRVRGDLLNGPAWILTPEDAILSKLQWRAESQSERQYRDVVGIAAAQWGKLDIEYLRHWAKILKLSDELAEALRDADELRAR